jgi:hypothetical protein
VHNDTRTARYDAYVAMTDNLHPKRGTPEYDFLWALNRGILNSAYLSPCPLCNERVEFAQDFWCTETCCFHHACARKLLP